MVERFRRGLPQQRRHCALRRIGGYAGSLLLPDSYTNTYAYTYTDANAYTYANAYTDANSHTYAYRVPRRLQRVR